MTRLRALLGEHPELATERLRNWGDHHRGASPLGYVAMLRYDTSHGVWRDVPDTGAMARALLDAGALVDGDPADSETPLMTAASYGDPEVARVLVEAGADLDAAASVTARAVSRWHCFAARGRVRHARRRRGAHGRWRDRSRPGSGGR